MTLGVFGGSFNPPHVGHLAVAEACAEGAGLDRVLWVPAATPPHKQGDLALASSADRLAMVRAAVEGNPRFEVSDIEIERDGVSYTVDTLRQLRAERPDDELALVVGGDSATGFASWREPREILDLARLIVYARPGADLKAVPTWVMERASVVEGPSLEISSTELRRRLYRAQTVRYLIPEAVRAVIVDRGLYPGVSGIGGDGGS